MSHLCIKSQCVNKRQKKFRGQRAPNISRSTVVYDLIFATILDKTVEKIAFLGGIFSKLRSRPILPSPPPLGISDVGSSKESRIPKRL